MAKSTSERQRDFRIRRAAQFERRGEALNGILELVKDRTSAVALRIAELAREGLG